MDGNQALGWGLCGVCSFLIGGAIGWMVGYGVPDNSQAAVAFLAAVASALAAFLALFKPAAGLRTAAAPATGIDPWFILGPFACMAFLFVGLDVGLKKGHAERPKSETAAKPNGK